MSRYKKLHESETVVVPVKMPEAWRSRLDEIAVEKGTTRSALIQDVVQKKYKLPKVER